MPGWAWSDPGSGDTQEGVGTRVELGGIDPPLEVIVGQQASGGRPGTYLRQAGQEQSYLASGMIIPSTDIQQWLAQPIIEIPAEEVQRVVVTHPDGELLTVSKQSRSDTTFKPFMLLQNRELSSDTVANPIGNVLSNLRLEDVLSSEELDPEAQEQVISTDFYTFDGLRLTARSFVKDDTPYTTLRAAYDAEQAQQFAAPEEAQDSAEGDTQDTEDQGGDTDTGEKAETEGERGDAAGDDGANAEQRAAELDQRLTGWVFQISQFKYDNLTKRLDDLLQPEETAPEPAASESAPEPCLQANRRASESAPAAGESAAPAAQ